jgi:hypothetical protein
VVENIGSWVLGHFGGTGEDVREELQVGGSLGGSLLIRISGILVGFSWVSWRRWLWR